MLELNQKVSSFILKNHLGENVSLNDFLGKKVVIYFYPKDSTLGCTKEACSFRNQKEDFDKLNTIVIGISKDSIQSHENFYYKQNLNFILLSDPNLDVIKYFDVYGEKRNYGKTTFGIIRSTFILDEEHKLIKVYNKVNPEKNALEIIHFLESIQ